MGSPPAINGDLREGSDIEPPCRGPSTFERLGRVLRHLPDPSKASRVSHLSRLRWEGGGRPSASALLQSRVGRGLRAASSTHTQAFGPGTVIKCSEAPRAGCDRGYGAPRSSRYLLVRGLHRIIS